MVQTERETLVKSLTSEHGSFIFIKIPQRNSISAWEKNQDRKI